MKIRLQGGLGKAKPQSAEEHTPLSVPKIFYTYL